MALWGFKGSTAAAAAVARQVQTRM